MAPQSIPNVANRARPGTGEGLPGPTRPFSPRALGAQVALDAHGETVAQV